LEVRRFPCDRKSIQDRISDSECSRSQSPAPFIDSAYSSLGSSSLSEKFDKSRYRNTSDISEPKLEAEPQSDEESLLDSLDTAKSSAKRNGNEGLKDYDGDSTSPSPQYQPKLLQSAKLTGQYPIDMNISNKLHLYHQILYFKRNTSQSELNFYSPKKSRQRAIQSLAQNFDLNYHYSLATRTLRIRRPVPIFEEAPDSEVDCEQSPQEEFLEKVFNETKGLTSCSPSTSTDSQGPSSQSNETPASSISSMSNFSGGPDGSNKKKRNSYDGEDGDNPGRPRKQGRTRPRNGSPERRQRGRRLACHFHLADKQKYCKNNLTGRRYETCSGPGWYTMHHVK
jgi:hypothetical protein